MTKVKFLLTLHEKLAGCPQDDAEERLSFYSEMIEDRMEEGLTEEEAVAAVGPVDEIAAQILADIPLTKIAIEKIKPKRRLEVWEIVLLILGAPIWVSLLAAAFSVVISVYAVVWSTIAALWSVFAAAVACAFSSIVGGICLVVTGYSLSGLALIAVGLVCGGLSVFLFYGCMASVKGTASLTKKAALWIKKCFVKKEGA